MFRVSVYRAHRVRRFCQKNSRLLLLLGLFLGGAILGCILFCAYGDAQNPILSSLLKVSPAEKSASALFTALYHACFQTVVLLGLLFFVGLSACGLPLILAVPFFFGLGLGMSEAYYYSTGWKGVLYGVLLLLLPSLFKAAALLMASAESMRMTLLFGSKLLEKESSAAGIHADFRLYRLRFLVFLLIALLGGIVEVLLGMAINL